MQHIPDREVSQLFMAVGNRDVGWWAVTAFALPSGGFLLLFGRTGDLYGRRRMYLTGVVIFLAGLQGVPRSPPHGRLLFVLQW